MWRFIEPFGEHTWTRVAVVRLKNEKIEAVGPYKQEKVAIKQPYHIKVNLSGQLPEKLKNAKILIDGQIKTDTTEPIVRDESGAYFIKRFDMLAQRTTFKFKILYNDGTFPPRSQVWHEVNVLPEPKLVPLDNLPSPQITLYPPLYTDLPKERFLPAGMRNMEMYAGTKVRFRAKRRSPAEGVLVYIRPRTLPSSRPGARGWGSSILQDRRPAMRGIRVTASVNLEGDKSIMQAEFTPWIDGKYTS